MLFERIFKPGFSNSVLMGLHRLQAAEYYWSAIVVSCELVLSNQSKCQLSAEWIPAWVGFVAIDRFRENSKDDKPDADPD